MSPIGGRDEVGIDVDPAKDFFDLVQFLFGGGIAGREAAMQARSLFEVLGEELRKGSLLSERAQTTMAQLRLLLSQVMSRTERPPGGEGIGMVVRVATTRGFSKRG
jgi:hypothetical protein